MVWVPMAGGTPKGCVNWHFGLELGLAEAKGTALGTSGPVTMGSEFLCPSS